MNDDNDNFNARISPFAVVNGFTTPPTQTGASSEFSWPSTPEGLFRSSSPPPISRPRYSATWPSHTPATRDAERAPSAIQRWADQTQRHERIAVGLGAGALGRRMSVLGLGLLDDFVAQLPELGRASALPMFDAAGRYMGWRPKVATWGWRGEKCEKNAWSEV